MASFQIFGQAHPIGPSPRRVALWGNRLLVEPVRACHGRNCEMGNKGGDERRNSWIGLETDWIREKRRGCVYRLFYWLLTQLHNIFNPAILRHFQAANDTLLLKSRCPRQVYALCKNVIRFRSKLGFHQNRAYGNPCRDIVPPDLYRGRRYPSLTCR